MTTDTEHVSLNLPNKRKNKSPCAELQENRTGHKQSSSLPNSNDWSDLNPVCKQSSKKRVLSSFSRSANLPVKPSALLYEITERTNQLAQPRARAMVENMFPPRLLGIQIPEASARVIELSKPRLICQQPSKSPEYVKPGALTAVATQRVIELSKPRKKHGSKIARRKKSIYDSESKAASLSRQKRRRNVESKINGSLKLRGEQLWCNEMQKRSRVEEQNAFYQEENCGVVKRKRFTIRKKHPLKTSNSSRTVIVIDLGSRNDSSAKSKKFSKFGRRKLFGLRGVN